VDHERGDADELLIRELLVKHGFDPDRRPRSRQDSAVRLQVVVNQ